MFGSIAKEIRKNGEYRFGRWGSFWRRFGLGRWNWTMSVCKFEESWSIHLFCLWITLWRPKVEPKEMMESWGFTLDNESRCIHFNWGDRCKIVYLPWMYDHCRTEVMLNDGTFVAYERFKTCKPGTKGVNGETMPPIRETPEPATRYRETMSYRYVLKSGTVQDRTATVTVERRAWCWRAWPFRLWRWPSKVATSIWVEFSDEVGEETGSWKGGTIGCGYDLRKGETPEQCLRRMESARTF